MFNKWEPNPNHTQVETSKIVAVDFDGVLHDSSFEKWSGADVILGDVVPGALDFVYRAINNKWVVVIVSSRFLYPVGPDAVGRWLGSKGFPIHSMLWSDRKPPAQIFIDDHAFEFKGLFPFIPLINGSNVHELARQFVLLNQEISRLTQRVSGIADNLKEVMLGYNLGGVCVGENHAVLLLDNGQFEVTESYRGNW